MKQLLQLIILAAIAVLVWWAAFAVRDHYLQMVQQSPPPTAPAIPTIQGALEQPIIIAWPDLATPEPTAIPVRIQSNEVEAGGRSSTAGGCTTKDTPLGRVTSCVSKEGE